jgi:hypothetical protein
MTERSINLRVQNAGRVSRADERAGREGERVFGNIVSNVGLGPNQIISVFRTFKRAHVDMVQSDRLPFD